MARPLMERCVTWCRSMRALPGSPPLHLLVEESSLPRPLVANPRPNAALDEPTESTWHTQRGLHGNNHTPMPLLLQGGEGTWSRRSLAVQIVKKFRTVDTFVDTRTRYYGRAQAEARNEAAPDICRRSSSQHWLRIGHCGSGTRVLGFPILV